MCSCECRITHPSAPYPPSLFPSRSHLTRCTGLHVLPCVHGTSCPLDPFQVADAASRRKIPFSPSTW